MLSIGIVTEGITIIGSGERSNAREMREKRHREREKNNKTRERREKREKLIGFFVTICFLPEDADRSEFEEDP